MSAKIINALLAIVPLKLILINKLEIPVTAQKGFTLMKINVSSVIRIAFDVLAKPHVSDASKVIILLMDNAFIQNIKHKLPGLAIKSLSFLTSLPLQILKCLVSKPKPINFQPHFSLSNVRISTTSMF